MICKKCGNELNDGAKFCPVCGAAADQEQKTAAPENKPSQPTASEQANKLIGGFIDKKKKEYHNSGNKILDLKTKLICIGGLLLVILIQHKCILSYGDVHVENGDKFTIHFLFTAMFEETGNTFLKMLYLLCRIASFGALAYALSNLTEYRDVPKKIILPVIFPFSFMTAWNLFGFLIAGVGLGHSSEISSVRNKMGMSVIFLIMLAANIVLLVLISRAWKKYKNEKSVAGSRLPITIDMDNKQVKLVQVPVIMADEYASCFVNEQTGELFKSVSTIKKKQVERLSDKKTFDITGETGNSLGVWKCEYCGKENDMKNTSCSNCYHKRG